MVPVLTKTAERLIYRSIGKRGETDNAQVDTYCLALGNWLLHLTRRLDGDERLARAQADGDVLQGSKHFAAVAVAHPAQFRQEDSAVRLVQLRSEEHTSELQSPC